MRASKSFFCLIISLLIFSFTSAQVNQPKVNPVAFANGFVRPVDISSAGDSRLFITEQSGRIFIVDSMGNTLPNPFLDIRSKVKSSGNEQGLLGLSFHPNYAQNGYFYVNYTKNNDSTVVARYSVNAANPNLANPNSEFILMTVYQPFSNHNAGDLAFGPDGFLYIGMGDGGWANDPGNRAQNGMEILGKMLRIDVDTTQGNLNYGIPPSNPFVQNANVRSEIWALGLRNPWRFSFDSKTGDFWIADVGQDDWEEIDFQPATSTGGENYGWRCYEGNAAFNTSGCGPMNNYTFPIHEYANSSIIGCSITGGFVYRGGLFELMIGHYVYADFCSGNIWSIHQDKNGTWVNTSQGQHIPMQYSTFGENNKGEIFMSGLSNGIIYRIEELCSELLPELILNQDTLKAQFKKTLPAGLVFSWYLNDTLIAGATNQTYIPTKKGDYKIRVSNPNNNCLVESKSFSYDPNGLFENEIQQKLKISPNPVSSKATIEIPDFKIGNYTLIVSDVSGRIVRKKQNIQQKNFIFDKGNLPKGLYFVELKGKQNYFGKLIID